MISTKYLAAVTLAAAVAAPVSVLAAGESGSSAGTGSRSGASAMPTFEQLDANRDGSISRAEYNAGHRSSAAGAGSSPSGAGAAGAPSVPRQVPGTTQHEGVQPSKD